MDSSGACRGYGVVVVQGMGVFVVVDPLVTVAVDVAPDLLNVTTYWLGTRIEHEEVAAPTQSDFG
jgi:hypothetical protein